MAREGSVIVVAEGSDHRPTKENPVVKKGTRPGRYTSKNSNNGGKAADQGQTESELTYSKCGNEAHPRITPCLANARRCLKCGEINNYSRVCSNRAAHTNEKRANQLELDEDTELYYVSREESDKEDVYAYQIKSGHWNNPTVELEKYPC